MTKMWEPPGGERGEKTFRYRLTYSSCSLNSRFMRSSYFKVPENKGKIILTNLPKPFKVSDITSLGKNYDFWKWQGAKFNQVHMRVPGNHRNQTHVRSQRSPDVHSQQFKSPLRWPQRSCYHLTLKKVRVCMLEKRGGVLVIHKGQKAIFITVIPLLTRTAKADMEAAGEKHFQVHIWKNLLLKTIFQIMERAALGVSEFPISVSIQAEGGDLLVRIATERIQTFKEWPGLQYPFSPSVPGTEWVSNQQSCGSCCRHWRLSLKSKSFRNGRWCQGRGGSRPGWVSFVSSPRRVDVSRLYVVLFLKGWKHGSLLISCNSPGMSNEFRLTDGMVHMSVGCWHFFLSNSSIYIAPLWPHLRISQSFWDFCRHDSATPNSKDMLLFHFYALKHKQTSESDNLAENIYIFFLPNMLIIKQVVGRRRRGHFLP